MTTTTETDAGFREPLRILTNQLNNISSLAFSRAQLMDQWFDPRRSIDAECGYPPTTLLKNYALYEEMYRRESIARRVVQALPKECWKVPPLIYESEDPDKLTPFEEDTIALGDSLRGEKSYYRGDEGNALMEYLYRMDIECGKGRYGVLFLGLNDGETDLSKPVKKASKLAYLRCFSEGSATISEMDSNLGPRYGHPLYYDIRFSDPDSYNTTIGVPTEPIDINQGKGVHWSRVIHVADNLDGNEVFGTPRMEPVWNRLLDLRKLYAGSAEMYWKGGFGGFSFETPPGIDPREVKFDKTKFKDEAEEFMNGLQKFVVLIGLNAKSLAPQVVDPTPQITVQLQAIAMYLNMPMRALMGSERGQLATMGDREEWHERLRARQGMFITPHIIVPFFDRLINLGVLRAPQKPKRSKFAQKTSAPGLGQATKSTGGYTIFWPDMESQTEGEKADNAFKLAQALAVYAEKGVQWVYPPRYFFTSILGKTEQEARDVELASEKYNKDNNHVPGQPVVSPTQPGSNGTPPNGQPPTNPPVAKPIVKSPSGRPVTTANEQHE